MNQFSRSAYWVLFTQALLLALMIWMGLRLSDAHASLKDSADNEKLAVKLAAEIEQLRAMDSVANDDENQVRIENSQVVELARMCGVTEPQIASIQRLPSEGIKNTDYQRHDTSLQFRAVTMEQLLRMGLIMERERPSAKVTAIHLTSNRLPNAQHKGNQELWNVELILTQLVYVARSAIN